ncbi:MAG TPA: hypothetical protein VEY95_11995 [Azospirillaceae bacterium]|nr:hypothetical protein [Azospirillaceae bacterium]
MSETTTHAEGRAVRGLTTAGVGRRLEQARRRIGGRLSLTWDIGATARFFVTHWLPAGPGGFGDCRTVAVGELDACLRQLDAYADDCAAGQARLARTLGLPTEGADGSG